MLFMDSATMILLPVYFKYISKNWIYFPLVSLLLNVLGTLGLFLIIPESPKYLLGKGRIADARTAL